MAEAASAATAIDAVEHHDPSALLLDVRLGDDDGFGVCGALTRSHPDLAVLLASDGDYEHMDEQIAACGAARVRAQDALGAGGSRALLAHRVKGGMPPRNREACAMAQARPRLRR